MSRPRTLALVLAGGAGSRMGVLTERRAKPALPFGGLYRLIDFPLSNCANSGIADVWVLQQYQPHALEEHLANGRPWDLDRSEGGLLILHPFTGGDEGGFNEGNADALWRQRRLIADLDPDIVLVLSADGVYTFDYRDLLDAHMARGADVTMATTTADDPERFGVVEVAEDGKVTGFWYKPDDPATYTVTMEVFAFRPDALLGTLEELEQENEELADFGHGLLPTLVGRGNSYEYRFDRYWRDVGTPDSYWQGHQDLLRAPCRLRLDDRAWPIRTRGGYRPPAHIATTADVRGSMVSPACKVSGKVLSSVLSPGVVVEEGAVVEDAVVLHDAVVRRGAHVRRAIVDTGVEVTARTHARSEDGEPVAVIGTDKGD
ncbi:MAG TPA: sugar phosphate nucleotidyltransferase [Acidimicrobiales bacterium]|nr:sugar phosphate nucleotidyltransferase [Acidimicrobiales bacterium]